MGWLGWKVQRAKHQQKSVAWVQQMGGSVLYDYQHHDGDEFLNVNRFAKPPGPEWTRQLLGVDFFSKVIRADLAGTNVTDLTPMSDMTGMESFFLRETQVSNLAPLARMIRMKHIWLGRTKVIDISPLTRMTDMKEMDLTGTQVSDLTPIGGMTGMVWLSLEGTLVNNLSPLAQVKELKILCLNDTGVTDLTSLADLTEIRQLYLKGTQVIDLTPLAGMTKMRELDLRRTKVTDLTPLAGLEKVTIYMEKTNNVTVPEELEEHIEIVASTINTPHKHLENGIPGRALEIMRADRKWIMRTDSYSRTPLHVAARYGHIRVVKWLLENGANVNATAYNGFTPLHLASDPEVVGLILAKRPALLDQLDVQRRTPFQDAADKFVDAHEGRPELYDDKQRQERKEIIDHYFRAGVEYDILTAIYLNDIKRVKRILKRSPQLADDFQNESPLRLAASLGRFEICRYLVEQHRVDVNDFKRGVGYPIIKKALKYPKIVRLLIENGADLKTRITWQGDRSGYWVIKDEATALHFAACHGVPESIKLLIDNGVDIFATTRDSFSENHQQTALEIASIFGNAKNARAIVGHSKFDQLDRQRQQLLLNRCLIAAASSSSFGDDGDLLALVEVFLEKGANPNSKQNGASPIQRFARKIHPGEKEGNDKAKELITVLLEHGAKLDLFSAVAIGDDIHVAQLIKQNPAALNPRGPDGYPALHFAVGMNYRKIVEQLLDAGCDVDIRNESDSQGYVGETALHCAAFWGRPDLARLLIERGADVNALTKRRITPLHSAARMSNVKTARLLLENGAKIDAKDTKGETPLDWCRKLHRSVPNPIEELFNEFQSRNTPASISQ